jgi:hypothetical protein
MPADLPELEDCSDHDVNQPMIAPCPEVPCQLGSRPEVIKDEDLVTYRKHLGWCVVVDGKMIPLCAFMRRLLRKPSLEIQEKVSFESLSLSYDPDTHGETLQSLACDRILGSIQSQVCMLIVNVIPNMEWKDHIKRMYPDPEYWRNHSIQERIINKLFSSTVDLTRRYEKGTLSMIDFGIELGSIQRMFHQSIGIFYFPPLETQELHHLHGIAMAFPSPYSSVNRAAVYKPAWRPSGLGSAA